MHANIELQLHFLLGWAHYLSPASWDSARGVICYFIYLFFKHITSRKSSLFKLWTYSREWRWWECSTTTWSCQLFCMGLTHSIIIIEGLVYVMQSSGSLEVWLNKMDINSFLHCVYIIIAQKKSISEIYSISKDMSSVEKSKPGEENKDGTWYIFAMVKKLSDINFQINVWFSYMNL